MDICSATDYADFDGTEQVVTFSADEGAPVMHIPVDVMIVDDDIDESLDEYFFVHFQVESAMDRSSISILRSTTTAIIEDDDGMFENVGEGEAGVVQGFEERLLAVSLTPRLMHMLRGRLVNRVQLAFSQGQ